MNQDVLDYLNRDKNACSCICSRETTPNRQEHIYITADDIQLYEFWYNPKTKQQPDKPKNTGGKKPYIMLMIDEIDKLKTSGIRDIDGLIGAAILLAGNISWSSGLIVNKRTQKPLLYDDIRTIFSCSNDKMSKKIKAMSNAGILLHDKDGYKISRDFIKRGGAK